jgi:para-nitrobenzyl esterase
VRNADQFGPVCPQAANGGAAGRTISEDCLNLDVWTGAKSASEKRPVMVWIHGGNAGVGVGDPPQFDGAALAGKGVVLVTVNYRGGVLGNLALPELSRESGRNASGNYGLMDDIAALTWVRKNISAFGGDPNNVTVFGQSFGADSIDFLNISPLAKGLYRRAITQSHARYPRDPDLFEQATAWKSLAAAEADGLKTLDKLGVHTLKDLREVPWQKLVEIDRAIAGSGADPGQILDGWVLPHTYSEAYALGAQHDVSAMAGDAKDEGGASPDTAFDIVAKTGVKPRVAFPAAFTLADYRERARKKFGARLDEFLALYPASTDREAFFASSAAARDGSRVSTWLWAGAWRAKATQPVYLYSWTHAPPGKDRELTGARHASELAYTFGNLAPPDQGWTDQDRRIADTMTSYWVNFARTGNPNGPGLAAWPAFDPGDARLMELGERFQPIPVADKAKLDFWRRFYDSQPAG